MSTDKVFVAFSPGSKLGSLQSFAPKVIDVRSAFNELAVFPHLESMKIGNSELSEDDQNLLKLVNDGIARFNNLTLINLGLARNVSTYNDTFSALIDMFDVKTLVATMQPVAKENAEHASTQFEHNKKFLKEFSEYVDTVNARIADMDNEIGGLDQQIAESSQKLASQNIVETLWKILKDVYKLATEASSSKAQIATLLNVTLADVAGTFGNLFQERERLEKVLKGLRALRDQLQKLKAKFTKLSKGLTPVLDDSTSLLDVWGDVHDRMTPLASDTSMVAPATSTALKDAWSKLAKAASDYVAAISSSGRTVAPSQESFSTVTRIPITKEEIVMAEWALQQPPSYSLTASYEAPPAYSISSSDEEVVKKVLNPPNDAKAQLDKLADNTGKIIDQFDQLLQQPFVEQLTCTDPQDPEGKKKTSIYAMTTYYRSQYLQLQLDTLPVARNLKSYAETQKALLPFVKVGKDVGPSDVDIKTFIDTNQPLVQGFKKEAATLADRHTKLKQSWDLAINAVQKSIKECNENIDKWQKSVDDMTEEKKKSILYAALLGAGALLAFAAAAFLPGGMLAALGIAGTLGKLTIDQIIKANKLSQAINELKSAIENAKQTRTKLENLLPFLLGIAQSLSDVTKIWNDIAQSLNTLDAFYKVLGGPTGPVILDKLRPTIIKNWDDVSKSCTAYINRVSK
ncbi:hypothetical protein VNI00_013709 [Paramarasmius palmivorus]|uniref:Uncharacterized protein n=1 Tax=Paramarasmius palmivorus TaxID=297713 RepID=A0AAW0BY67_9AGAR